MSLSGISVWKKRWCTGGRKKYLSLCRQGLLANAPGAVCACTWAGPGLAGPDRAISFLAGVSVTESQGTVCKEVSDCGDCGLREQLGEEGAEISMGVSRFWTSSGGESGLSSGKYGMSPGECGTSVKCEILPGDCGVPLGDCGAPTGD